MQTSEVNNPFVFKAVGHNSVGLGSILALSSTTKALSQGQFGQFPLYAFTEEGIWALEVSSTGTFTTKHPTTRDICNNPQSITQLDGAIAFSTEQGIMMLEGASSKCISEVIDSTPFEKSTLYNFADLILSLNLSTIDFDYIPFKEYLINCQIAYDYPNSKLIIFNPSCKYTYMFNFKGHTWSVINGTYKRTINSYPDSYCSKVDGDVINLSERVCNYQKIKGLIITRPIKLSTPDLLKTITQAIHRGIFENRNVKTVLYGSRDCVNFIPIASSADHTIRSVHGGCNLNSVQKTINFVLWIEIVKSTSKCVIRL